jgi:hypothetical protein
METRTDAVALPEEQSTTTTSESQDAGMMFSGKIEGGWGYVAGAYGISLGILLVYVLMVTFRLRGLKARDGRS